MGSDSNVAERYQDSSLMIVIVNDDCINHHGRRDSRLVIFDPPYRMRRTESIEQWHEWIKPRLLKARESMTDDGSLLFFEYPHNVWTLAPFINELGLELVQQLTIMAKKDGATNGFRNISRMQMFPNNSESCYWFRTVSNGNRKRRVFSQSRFLCTGIMRDCPRPHGHRKLSLVQGQKPYSLIVQLVKSLTEARDRVTDFFCGAGTVPLACASNGRECFSTELNERHFEIAKNYYVESFYHEQYRTA